MRCGACGTENPSSNRFCDSCGSPLSATCPQCGAPNRADARFCGSCGTTLGGAPAGAPAGAAGAAPPGHAGPGAAAERRIVSVLFTDLVGFTSLAEDRDPEAVRELLSRYFDTATRIIELHGGTVEKFIGDAVMAVWGTPVAHEDDAERAVRAGLELVDAVATLHPDLQARAGILTGEAAVTVGATNQGMVAGDLVNTAARLQGVAEPGTVLVGEATRRAAEQSIVFEPLGDHSLKGKTAPVPAWRAVRVVAQRGGQGRSDGLEPPFVGREEELRQLKEVLHAVGRERRPRLVSITGPAGIGKSRLVWELEKYVDGVAEPIYWHRGRSPAYGEGITFWALGEMVRRRARLTEDADDARTREAIAATLEQYVPDASDRERIGPALLSLLGLTDAPAGGREALFPAWRLFFERIAEHGTTVLVFEDLHWADAGTLDLVEHILDWSRGLPIVVVTLARPELFDRRPDWGAGRKQMTALALEPLPDDAMSELLAGMVPGLPADATAAVVGRAEGVPLYAVEMVRALLADGLIERVDGRYVPTGDLSRLRVPESLRLLIAARLDALDPDDRALLQDASVFGQVFGADSLAAATGVEAPVLEGRLRTLVRRELLDVETDPRSPERGQYRFVQALIQEVAYETLARRERRAKHLALARHYEAVGDDELAAVLASHYRAAHEASEPGPEADAIATQARLALVAAADRAAALGSFQQAVRYIEQAIELVREPRELGPLLDRAADAAMAAAIPEGRSYAERAVAAYRENGDDARAVAATVRLGVVLIASGEVAAARDTLQEVVPEAEALGDRALLAAVLANLSRAHMRNAESQAAVDTADRALAIAEADDLEEVLAEALLNKGSGLNQLGRRREAAALMAVALTITRKLGDRRMEIRALNNYGVALVYGSLRDAHEVYRETTSLARDVGDWSMYVFALGNLAAGGHSLGQWDDGLDELRAAYEASTLPSDRLRLGTQLALRDVQRGRRLDEWLDELRPVAGGRDGFEFRFPVMLLEALVAIQRGAFAEAFESAVGALELGGPNPEIPVNLALRAAIASANEALVRRAAALVADLRVTGPVKAFLQDQAEGAVAAIEGDAAGAAALFRSAYDHMMSHGARWEAALTAASAHALLPDHPEVRDMVADARIVLEELDVQPMLRRLATAPTDARDARPADIGATRVETA